MSEKNSKMVAFDFFFAKFQYSGKVEAIVCDTSDRTFINNNRPLQHLSISPLRRTASKANLNGFWS